jgi:hypothetical protein
MRLSAPPSLEHLIALSDDVGILQHAERSLPNRHHGYCTDDVARALMVAVAATEHDASRDDATRLVQTYLSFMHHAQMPDGRFHNFMSYDRTWLDEVGSDDSNGRAIWSIGFTLRYAPLEEYRELSRGMLERALPNVGSLGFMRSRVYAALGLVHAYEALKRRHPAIEAALREIGASLYDAWSKARSDGWEWFEDHMTYDNARLSEAALKIGSVLEDRALIDLGRSTLNFYNSVVVEDGRFVPIGNAGWYYRGGARARYGQQPLEAASMVDANLAAYAITGESGYSALADLGLAWFYGRNTRNVVMARNGGCCDGLEEVGVNENMGAESSLAYLASAFALARPASDALRLAR